MVTSKKGELSKISTQLQEVEIQAIRLALESGCLLDKGMKALSAEKRSKDFEEWVKGFGLSRRTAFNRIAAARTFSDTDDTTLSRFELSALYELGQGTVAPRAVKEAIGKAKGGETVTRETALELMKKYKGK